jgi:hypothetical protein
MAASAVAMLCCAGLLVGCDTEPEDVDVRGRPDLRLALAIRYP